MRRLEQRLERISMTNLAEIIELNRQQIVSEEDPFTERRYLQFVRRFAPQTRDVLDVGCNTGRGGAVIKTLLPGVRITGIDCVPERIEALDPGIYETKICGFTHAIPLPADSFDVIVAGEFIEHVASDLVFKTLCEFFRLLRLNGILLLTTPNPRYLKNVLKQTSVLGGAHISQHYIRNLRSRLMDIGFSGVRIRGSGRVSSILGEFFPLRTVYGSYLVQARKW
jgi:2-polyprenyl-3-methyl-5-hydroxy-6-metoxy-1,4-benzoquinol methylase